jgi:hypothetical protein
LDLELDREIGELELDEFWWDYEREDGSLDDMEKKARQGKSYAKS